MMYKSFTYFLFTTCIWISASEMTYIVSGGALNYTHSLTCIWIRGLAVGHVTPTFCSRGDALCCVPSPLNFYVEISLLQCGVIRRDDLCC